MDFFLDEGILNFIEPPPEKLPAMEQVRKDRFSIKQLRTIVTELEELSKEFGDGQGGVPNKVVTDLLMRKLENSKSLQDDGSLPEEWWSLSEYDFQNAVRNLDALGHGVISWRQLATYFVLLKSPLPSDKDLDTYKQSFKSQSDDLLIDQQQFLSVSALYLLTNPNSSRHGSMRVSTPRTETILWLSQESSL